MNRPSTWWPVPASASSWFSPEERVASAAYHGPLVRAVTLRVAGQFVGLLGVLLAFGHLGPSDLSLALAALAVTVARWVPATVVDVWHDLRHEPQFGGASGRPGPLLVSTIGRFLAQWFLWALIGWVVIRLPVPRTGFVSLLIAAGLLPFAALVFAPRISLKLHRGEPLLDSAERSVLVQLEQLAGAFGVPGVAFVRLRSEGLMGANAFATGTGPRITVGMTDALLTAPRELRDHVVAHELAHVRRHHVWWSALGLAMCSMAIVGISIPFLSSPLAARLTSDGPALARLPLAALSFSLMMAFVQVLLAWLSRAHERRADLDAARFAAVDPRLLRTFHVSERALLEPSLLARLVSAHPSPAERLELLKRAGRPAEPDAKRGDALPERP